jgi:hypothetical protein
MANETTRLSTADLRRRLLAVAPAAAMEPEPVAAPVANLRPPAGRLAVPPTLAELPVAEDEPTYPIAELTPEAHPPIHTDPTPVPFNRITPPDLRRPSSQSSVRLPRPLVSLAPAADPLIEQLRHEAEHYRGEAQALQQLMEEMRQLLQEASEQEQRVQAELADRDQKVTAASARIQELETIINTKPKTKTELEEWADELERESMQISQERRTMDKDRQQLREDETALETQMREMEVGMARERALLARQEQELKRLNAEIQHELELMQRGDGALRERMAQFQRRHAEATGAPMAGSYYGATTSPVATAHPTPPPKKNDTTGLLRKLFRSGE